MFGHNRAGWQLHARPNENCRPTHGKRRRTRLVPRPGPRTADNHRREPLSVSQPTHTFKFPDPAPCFCCPPYALSSKMHAPDPRHTEGRGISSSVSQASQLSRGKNAIIRAGKNSEQGTGDFHACLYSLRDHPHGSDWSRRLLGAPRKGRCPRALEARLNGAEIASDYFFSACLSLRQSQPRPSFLSRGLLRVCLPKNPRPVLSSLTRSAS